MSESNLFADQSEELIKTRIAIQEMTKDANSKSDIWRWKELLLNNEGEAKNEIIKAVKSCMREILIHYIECSWAPCYMTAFNYIIKDYLDDSVLLDEVLKSETIKETENIVQSTSGAKIFPNLYEDLRKVKSAEIQKYLRVNFFQLMNKK
jgi:hypothetical protein